MPCLAYGLWNIAEHVSMDGILMVEFGLGFVKIKLYYFL
jgi:hypothetical protein